MSSNSGERGIGFSNCSRVNDLLAAPVPPVDVLLAARTKFAAKRVAWPVAKTVLLKAPEKVAVLGLKTVGFSLRKGIPTVGKIGFAYLKTKLP